jgi:hypothetical protein
MPRVRVVQYAVENDRQVFLLKVTNPTLGAIRLRFAGSSYDGEPDPENDGEKTTLLPNLLVNTFSQRHIDAKLECSVLQTLTPTESVELLSAEDSFIELGGKSKDVPDAVENWSTSTAVAGAGVEFILRLVSQSVSTAWFELILPEMKSDPSATVSPAIPLALQIEVGNGSWQSSLIQPLVEGQEGDWVTFDLVITWS